MNHDRLDAPIHALAFALSRRGLVRVFTSVGLTSLAGWPLTLSGGVAKKRGKKRKKKTKTKKPLPQSQPPPQPSTPPLNAFGCLDVGQPCQGDGSLCCSGNCEPSTATCVAHNTGICTPQHDSCAAGVSVKCNPNNNECYCTMTTGNAPFCGDFTGDPAALCRVCSKDTDCQAEFGPGAACILLDEACTAICPTTGRTACVPPCA